MTLLTIAEFLSVSTFHYALFAKKGITCRMIIAIHVQKVLLEFRTVMNVDSINKLIILMGSNATHVRATKFQLRIIIIAENRCNIV